ncbi:RNA-DNA hybrid ribonuclease [Phytophthora pseudosyringae]|uniref:ribonuclease H n=1 Tax=Phytophthora pseudosyringae TaxID=221518 RepID=A0A8T1W3J7_9STRA|nr:RNA-DNA hybrid ribonuclease [Phytophthora pseudosyringae]
MYNEDFAVECVKVPRRIYAMIQRDPFSFIAAETLFAPEMSNWSFTHHQRKATPEIVQFLAQETEVGTTLWPWGALPASNVTGNKREAKWTDIPEASEKGSVPDKPATISGIKRCGPRNSIPSWQRPVKSCVLRHVLRPVFGHLLDFPSGSGACTGRAGVRDGLVLTSGGASTELGDNSGSSRRLRPDGSWTWPAYRREMSVYVVPEPQDPSSLVAFCDGSAIGNGQYSGIHVHFPAQPSVGRGAGGQGPVCHQQRAEYVAALEGIKRANVENPKQDKTLIIYSDSELLVNSMSKWVIDWMYDGWVTSSGAPVKNCDLQQLLLEARGNRRAVKFEHVKAYTGGQDWKSRWNDVADQPQGLRRGLPHAMRHRRARVLESV